MDMSYGNYPPMEATGMQFESPQKKPVVGHGCPTPPSASPVKDEFASANMSQHGSPQYPTPKHVSFELLLDDNSKMRARIPMRVQIFPHDTTDSIVTTVKNFYGIYEATASGVSFEDEDGHTLIARYENLRNNMTVYVRVIFNQGYSEHFAQQQAYYGPAPGEAFNRPALGEPFQMPPPPQTAQDLNYGRSPSRPSSRIARKRSQSPAPGRRSDSTQKASSRAGGNKSRGSSTHGSFHDDAFAHYSDSDGAHSSVASSRKARSEQFASSDISMENILLDGRRKRPKFESSELPLFAPPQVPITTSTSSISPQRRSTIQEAASPYSGSAQRPFATNQPLPSPQSFGHHEQLHALHKPPNPQYATPTAPQHGHRLRDRSKMPATYYPNSANRPSGSGILPTPDPTIASCISDEDVAMQLIRLGDASNFSHGRNSASTFDDAFSGVADAASSAGVTSDGTDASGDESDEAPSERVAGPGAMLPPGAMPRKNLDDILPSVDAADRSRDNAVYQRGAIEGDTVHNDHHYAEPAPKRVKPNNGKAAATKPPAPKQSSSSSSKASNKSSKPRSSLGSGSRKGKTVSSSGPIPANNNNGNNKSMGPPTPGGVLHTTQRQPANTHHHQLAAGEEDLSTKPRCQRCRKSKKGCDRQRPCQRCRDAGIGIEGCISEDEGNGRKGRYGRHMGVPVNSTVPASSASDGGTGTNIGGSAGVGFASEYQQPAPVHTTPGVMPAPTDKNKKRKR